MVALRKRLPVRMDVQEFLAWDAQELSGRRWELRDGRPVLMAPASERHGAIQSELARLLGNHIAAVKPGCRVITAPGVVPHVRSDENFRIPDLGVTCAPPSGSVMTRDPVLLIEILSPGNEARTRSNIWTYTTIPSVREILAVHSTKMKVELLRREPDGNWPAMVSIVRPPELLTLHSLDFAVPVIDVYRTAGLEI
ncbi:MAG: Uma2 family endonuclease [Acetobacteraceae bacterium]